jgi:hypothetical protein
MPTLRGNIEADGALVNVQFGPSDDAIRRLRARLRPIPQAVGMRALLDIGSDVTCVEPA